MVDKKGGETAVEEKKEMTAKRRERIPLNRNRMKLSVPSRPGYVRRWVNDVPGRLYNFERAGYEFVTDPDLIVGEGDDVSQRPGVGSVVSRMVGSIEATGQPLRAYLMEIPQEYYDEDQAVKAAEVDERENAMRRGQDSQGSPGDGARYIPKTPIKIEHSNR